MAFEETITGVCVCDVWGGGDGAFTRIGVGEGVDAGGECEDLYVIVRTAQGCTVDFLRAEVAVDLSFSGLDMDFYSV